MAKEKPDYLVASEEKLRELNKNVLDIAKNFETSTETLIEYLKFQNRFYNYSARNTMLIQQQNPAAGFCNSFKAFKDLGLNIKKGQHGMKILVPTLKTYLKVAADKFIPLSKATDKQKSDFKNGKIESFQKLYFKIGTVFDITQTDCSPSDYPKYLDIGYTSEQHTQLYNILKNYSENVLNCPVRNDTYESVSLRGFFDSNKNEIHISKTFDDTTRLSIMSHELGHAILHNTKAMGEPQPVVQVEFEADALSVMLLQRMGIDIPESRQCHLADVFTQMRKLEKYTPEMLTKSLDRVNKAFKQVVEAIKGELTPDNLYNSKTQITQAQQPILPNQIPDMTAGFVQSM